MAVLAAGSLAFASLEAGERILNSTQSNPREHTYQVQLTRMVSGRRQFFCSGVVVTNRNVLTVARCVRDVVPGQLIVRSGPDITIGTDYLVQAIHIHPQFNFYTVQNDIAVIRLQRPIVFNNLISRIPLPTVPTSAGVLLNATGWGSTTVSYFIITPCDSTITVLHHHFE